MTIIKGIHNINVNKKKLISLFTFLILSFKILYYFEHLGFIPASFFNYFSLLKEVLIFIFILFIFGQKKKITCNLYLHFFIFIHFVIFFKFIYYNFYDFSYLIIYKNFIIPFSLIYLAYYISYEDFLRILKKVLLLLGFVILIQILNSYNQNQFKFTTFSITDFTIRLHNFFLPFVKSDVQSLESTISFLPGFISNRLIGIFDSPNSLSKFAALSLIILFVDFFCRNKINNNFLLLNFSVKKFIKNYDFYLYFIILLISIYFSMTISVILTLLFLIVFYFIFLSNFKYINLIFFLIFFSFSVLVFSINYQIILKVMNRFEDLFQFITYINSLTLDELLVIKTTDAEAIKSGFGTYVARVIDFINIINCYQNDKLGFLFFGCKFGFDFLNIGYLNLISMFGILPNLIIFFYIIKLIFKGYKIFKKKNKNYSEFKIIYFTFCAIFMFIFLINFLSKIIEISVVNYLVFIIFGYALKYFNNKDKKFYI